MGLGTLTERARLARSRRLSLSAVRYSVYSVGRRVASAGGRRGPPTYSQTLGATSLPCTYAPILRSITHRGQFSRPLAGLSRWPWHGFLLA